MLKINLLIVVISVLFYLIAIKFAFLFFFLLLMTPFGILAFLALEVVGLRSLRKSYRLEQSIPSRQQRLFIGHLLVIGLGLVLLMYWIGNLNQLG